VARWSCSTRPATSPAAFVKRIVPEFNSLVLFRVSPRSWHQVAEVVSDVQRLTVTGWYHG